ncbi:MAG: hypothetical protein AAF577_04950 [Pseudomonadota bacterium]
MKLSTKCLVVPPFSPFGCDVVKVCMGAHGLWKNWQAKRGRTLMRGEIITDLIPEDRHLFGLITTKGQPGCLRAPCNGRLIFEYPFSPEAPLFIMQIEEGTDAFAPPGDAVSLYETVFRGLSAKDYASNETIRSSAETHFSRRLAFDEINREIQRCSDQDYLIWEIGKEISKKGSFTLDGHGYSCSIDWMP